MTIKVDAIQHTNKRFIMFVTNVTAECSTSLVLIAGNSNPVGKTRVFPTFMHIGGGEQKNEEIL